MKCILNWNSLSAQDWKIFLDKACRPSLLQSYAYAQAIAPIYGQRPNWCVIEIDGQQAGAAQIMEAKILGGAIHAVILDRGPFWFDGYGSPEHVEAFIKAYSQQFPRRWGRKRRMIPEIDSASPLTEVLIKKGWRHKAGSSYQTSVIDLTQEPEALLANMRKSWRQSLRKSQKTEISIEWDIRGKSLPLHLKYYQQDKQRKSYDGPDPRIVRALVQNAVPTQDALLGTARLNEQSIAGIIVLRHGSAATYQIGWSTAQGRDLCAHHNLLWQAALYLKEQGVKDFDLGGMNDGGAKTVKRFKEGMGGQTQTLAGLYT